VFEKSPGPRPGVIFRHFCRGKLIAAYFAVAVRVDLGKHLSSLCFSVGDGNRELHLSGVKTLSASVLVLGTVVLGTVVVRVPVLGFTGTGPGNAGNHEAGSGCRGE
jgi:hypothetical protein